MTVNYYVKCPVCGKITRMRSPAGYIYSTPVRIHCGNCNTLLTGKFISDNKRIKAYFVDGNCTSVYGYDNSYDYFAEASGEMICNKLRPNENGSFEIVQSPVFDFAFSFSLEDRENFINYATYLSNTYLNWDTERIKYDLYLNRQYDLLIKNYSDIANDLGYTLNNTFDCVKFIYFSLFKDLWGIQNDIDTKNILRDLNYHFVHLNNVELVRYIDYLKEENRLYNAEKKIIELFFDFVSIGQNITPAIAVCNYYNRDLIDKVEKGISTCTFEDISNYYQSAYETLVEYSDIVVALDNIYYRNDYSLCFNNKPISEFYSMHKGNKIKQFNYDEFFSKTFNIKSDSNKIRNAIGHNDYKYDGKTQILEYEVDSKTHKKDKIYLIDIAINCVDLTRSLLVLLFLIYELIRLTHNSDSKVLPKFMYSNTKSSSRCICGSDKKYRNCCKNKNKINISSTTLFENVANCSVDAKSFFDSLKSKPSPIPYNVMKSNK